MKTHASALGLEVGRVVLKWALKSLEKSDSPICKNACKRKKYLIYA